MPAASVEIVPIGFRSHDGTSQIRGAIWKPASGRGAPARRPVGIVQIVHGMSEHIGRYEHFARFLVSRGFIVCAHDHIGHGKSVQELDQLGCMPLDGGKDILIEDTNELRRMVAARYPQNIPYVLFGHSMGSFIVRAYLARYAEGLAGAVLCGTGEMPETLSKAGNFLARRIGKAKGANYKSPFLHRQGAGAYSARISKPRTEFDWISTDPAVVDAFIADERCGAVFSVGGYATLTDLTREIASLDCALKVPKDLPVLFVAGSEDPVGDCGRGVHTVVDLFLRAGVGNTRVKMYEGMRHEILNEPGNSQVYTDIAEWLEGVACRATS